VIAIDTSSWIAFFSDREPDGDDTALVESALTDPQARLPPFVLTEILSDPKLPRSVARMLQQLHRLEPKPGFWERTGRSRARLLTRRHRDRLAETLIAQTGLDHGVRLVMRDADFRHFARLTGLRLAL